MRHLNHGQIAALGVAGWLAALSAQGEITGLVKSDRVNLRAAPSVLSEIICHLHQGEKVVILESIKPDRPQPGELAEWLKIRLPANTPVWVSAEFIDDTASTVTAHRLNVRAGPGDNFTIIGSLERGAIVREIRVVEDWMEIEAPPGCYGFVAASYVDSAGGSTTPVPAPNAGAQPAIDTTSSTAPVPASSPAGPAPAPPPSAAHAASAPLPPQIGPPMTLATPGTATPSPAPAPPAPPPAAPEPEPPKPAPATPSIEPPATAPAAAEAPETGGPSQRRIVRREGIVAETLSIQAPTRYHLRALDTGRSVNFLLPGDPAMRIARFRGARVVVTGEEQLDPRWPQLPMIEVQSIQLAP
ncbi:MAG TPA: SH3 domain-containing protein [Verrucomicrobiota bacterium]|nr:SH3 domain-containing protein [Verrucomicrobiota bacterium]HNU49627.1 SH3 domain-containing protein [Verrucomicrobiota bacterium]